MPGWSTSWSFFLIVSFIIYVIARGDLPQWKKIFNTSMGSGYKPATIPSVPGGTTNPYGATPDTPMVY
jgi:hypothetical protein